MPDQRKKHLSNEEYARLRELEARLMDPTALTKEEYSKLLHETKKNYMVMLAMASIERQTKGTGAYIHLIEKTHYLLESVEGKPTHRVDVTHSVDEKSREEFRRMLMDPKNIQNILEIEGLILENVTDARA